MECDDGTVCTDDESNPDTGLCEYTPANEGQCCEEDPFDCTEDVCQDGVCIHPEKDPPVGLGDSVSYSFSKKYGKNMKFPVVGKIGFGTELSFDAEASVDPAECSLGGEVSGAASLNATFFGPNVTIDGEAAGSYGCSAPLECPEGCDNRKECDEDEKCCTASGSGELTFNRGFTKRVGIKLGSVYFSGSYGAGFLGSASKSWPQCDPNQSKITIGALVQGSASGGLEVCNWLTKRICGCQQGRDPWTGRFQTACSDCSRCSPYASASLSGRVTAQVTWKRPGGVSGKVTGKGCFSISPIELGPVSFSGYQACLENTIE